MTKARTESLIRLDRLGVDGQDAATLLRASALLHTWYEHSCNGVIQRDESSGKTYWHSALTGKRLYATPDRETGTIKRVQRIAAKYGLMVYVQSDPRGCSLYLYQPAALREYSARNGYEADIDAVYSSIGIPVYS